MRIALSIALSLVLHGLLASVLALFLLASPRPDVLVELDLSSVELSFSERPDETQRPVTALPPSERVAPARPEMDRAPEEDRLLETDAPYPENADAVLPVPDEATQVATPEPIEAIPAEPSVEPAPETSAPRQARIDALPKQKGAIRPDYPKSSRQRGEQGDVTLELSISASGHVEAAEIVVSSGFPDLDTAALRAARKAQFVPARSEGRPVSSRARLTLSFRLKEGR